MKRLPLFFALCSTYLIFSNARVLDAAEQTPMRVVSHFLTSGESLSHQKRTPQTKFTPADYVVFIMALQWDDVTKSRGRHTITWNWYQGDKLISSATKIADFNHTPFDLYSKRAASDLGVGQFKAEMLMDKSLVASNRFTIAP